MPNIEDYKTGQSFKIQLNGPHGTGKSIAAASFHKAGHLYIAEFDGRFEPVAKHYQGKTKDISYTNYGSNNFRAFIEWLDKVQDQSPPLTPEGKVFKTLVIDSITMLSMSCVLYQLDKTSKWGAGKTGIPKTEWAEINGETMLFTKMMEIIKNMNKQHNTNIIVCTHPIIKTDPNAPGEDKKVESIVAYGNKVPSFVPGYFNEIYKLAVRKEGLNPIIIRRYAITSVLTGEGDVLAKSALNLPQEIDVTNGLYDAMMKHINPEVKSEVKEVK